MLILVCAFASTVPTVQSPGSKFWIVLVCGSKDIQGESAFLYKTLVDHYPCTDIYYLHVNTSFEGVDALSTKENVRSAFTSWLAERSTENDKILVYIMSHGGGYNKRELILIHRNSLCGGRAEVSWDNQGKPAYSDEGNETLESNTLHQNTTTGAWEPTDVNGDGDFDDWVGVDECIWLEGNTVQYWDDELASDLSGLSYKTLILVDVGCLMIGEAMNSTEHCFSGGFIDDLSAPNRIIVTPTNETGPAFGSGWGQMSSWGKEFISALDVGTSAFNEADLDSNGKVSIKEAFGYAWEHDYYRQAVWGGTLVENGTVYDVWYHETPWLDDNGNGLPTFREGQDVLDPADGELASQTYLCSQYLTIYALYWIETGLEWTVVSPDVYVYEGPYAINFTPGWPVVTLGADVYVDGELCGLTTGIVYVELYPRKDNCDPKRRLNTSIIRRDPHAFRERLLGGWKHRLQVQF